MDIFGLILFALAISILLADQSAEALEVTSVETTNSFNFMVVESYVESTVRQKALVAIYVEGQDSTPIGVMLFKTTLLPGTTPIEFGVSLQDNEVPTKTYVNIFTDHIERGGIPLAMEYVEESK